MLFSVKETISASLLTHKHQKILSVPLGMENSSANWNVKRDMLPPQLPELQ